MTVGSGCEDVFSHEVMTGLVPKMRTKLLFTPLTQLNTANMSSMIEAPSGCSRLRISRVAAVVA
jgi:hypothetical protein